MSTELPTLPDAEIGNLPESDCERRTGPKPAAHGSSVQAVFRPRDDQTEYDITRDLWRDRVESWENEPGVIDVGDAFDQWLPEARYGRDWVLLLSSSGWKAGTGEGDDWTQWYQYHLKLREVDEHGEFHKPPCALHVEIIPQDTSLNYSDGNDITLPYGEGALVRCSTTWAESGEEVESRMLDTLELVLDADRDDLQERRVFDSRRISKAEAHHRVSIGYKRQVIDVLDRSRQLIAYGGASEIESHQRRKREGYIESVVDADRWHLLGFERRSWNIELKVYQASHWSELSPSDPAHHPKLEASFSGVNGDGSLPHVEDWDHCLEVLRNIVSSHLDWAGVERGELIEDDYQSGPTQPEYTYAHPTGRREQLRERYESVATQIYAEATKASTTAVYDILSVVATESGANYDTLVERTGLTRSTIRYHCQRLQESGVVDRVGNPVIVCFPSLQVLDKADEILNRIYPDDMAEDLNERAEQRRERREERNDPDEVDDGLQEESDDDRDQSSSSSSTWRYFDALEMQPHQLANALEREYLDGDEVRVRVDRRDWVE